MRLTPLVLENYDTLLAEHHAKIAIIQRQVDLRIAKWKSDEAAGMLLISQANHDVAKLSDIHKRTNRSPATTLALYDAIYIARDFISHLIADWSNRSAEWPAETKDPRVKWLRDFAHCNVMMQDIIHH